MVWKFFIDNIPSWQLISWLVPISLVYTLITLYFSGWLKQHKNWKTGYSRKLFHFSIFSVAGLVQVFAGYPGTIVFGSSVSIVIFYSIWQGSGHIMFEAMAREKDAPKQAHYIVMPYLATLLGGLFNNFLFVPEVAICGYMVAGLGDAVAEPIGTRFGKHPYRVPSLLGVPSTRSLEGSTAVLIGSFYSIDLCGISVGPRNDTRYVSNDVGNFRDCLSGRSRFSSRMG